MEEMDVQASAQATESLAVSVLPFASTMPKPAYRVRKGAMFFRLGLGLFLLLSGFLTLVSCASVPSSLKWQGGAKGLGEEALFELVLNNVSAKTPVEHVQLMMSEVDVSRLGRTAEQELWMVRFKAEEVCGRLGCLHMIVARTADKEVSGPIWSQYIHTDIPTGPALSFVSVPNGAVDPTDFACIEIRQVNAEVLRHSTQCYESGSYRVVAEGQSSL